MITIFYIFCVLVFFIWVDNKNQQLMDEVENQSQENQSLPQITQNSIKESPIPELANHSSKQAPIFHDVHEEKQEVIKDSQVEKYIENIVQQDTQKPEQLSEQIVYNQKNAGNTHQQIENLSMDNKVIMMDLSHKEVLNKGSDIIDESPNNQKKQVNLPVQNEENHQKPSEFPISLEPEQQRQTNINQPQKIQYNIQKIEEIQKKQYSQEEKQKIRLNTQLMQSSFNDKEKPVVEFEQYNHNITTHNQQSLPIISTEPEQQIKNKSELSHLQDHIQAKEEFILPKVEPSFYNSVQNSPRKEGAGKIARKKLHEKGIYDALLSLQKKDKKQQEIYELAQKRELSTNKIDLSKLQTNITLNSNVVNVTVTEPQQQKTQEQKLLFQVQQLRKKLLNLQVSKNRQREDSIASNKSLSALYNNQEYIHLQNMSQQESSEGDYYIASKHDRRRNIGKFYRLVENNNAKISEELRILGFRGKSEFQKQTFSARKPKTNSFRVRKNNKSNYLSNQKDHSIEQIPQNDECFQVKREITEKLLFDQEDKLNFIQKPTPRNLFFEQNFKQYIQSFFVPNILQKPFQNNSQTELVQLAKITFSKFGVNIKQDKSKVLHVRKYKNCVSFILENSYTIIWHYEGRFYLGGWQVDENGDGHKQGWGYENSPNKFTYSGQFKDNKRDGYGIMKICSKKSEIIYEGEWKDGAKHGLGKQLEADLSIYIGGWQDGKKQGRGKMIISESQEYEGQFKNGLKWGKGKQKFKNGDHYVGEYSQGKFHGKGIYTWSNFSRYQGSFKEGKRCGNGVWAFDYRNPQTDSYEGQYLNDKKHGFGKYHWKDGTIYQGEFQNDLKHGEGVITQPNGRVVRLDWMEGSISSKKYQPGIDESVAVTPPNKNQPFKIKQQRNSQRSIKALKLNLRGNKKSNYLISA